MKTMYRKLLLHYVWPALNIAVKHERSCGDQLDVLWLALMLCTLCHQCKGQCSETPGDILLKATEDTQLLHSLNYPDTYPNDASCSWIINAPLKTGRIMLTVLSHDIFCCCNGDRLTFYDGGNGTEQVIAILCSEDNPITLTSSGSALYGKFVSDGSDSGLGYSLEYSYYDSSISCPPGWLKLYDYCYKLYLDPISWDKAASRCGYDGGFLASIGSQEENQFLVDWFSAESANAWIGMNNSHTWIDGSNISYENFQGSRLAAGLCARLILYDSTMTGWWEVVDCSLTGHFLCKKSVDGSGGRYWTHFNIDGDKGGGIHSFILPIFFIVIFIAFTCFCSDRRARREGNSLECLCEAICSIVTGIGHRVRDMRHCINEALRSCVECQCCPSEVDETRGESGDHRGNSVDDRPPVATLSSDQSNSDSSVAVPATDLPPSYGEAIAEPPPPSYFEALDPAFTPSVSVSTSDISPGLHVPPNSDPHPAPSYESVVNVNYSDSNV